MVFSLEPKPRKASLLEKAAQAFDLPGNVVAGLPLIELRGDGELRMENHSGILAYGEEEIHISGGKMAVRVIGTGLDLRLMNAVELVITGRIARVEFN